MIAERRGKGQYQHNRAAVALLTLQSRRHCGCSAAEDEARRGEDEVVVVGASEAGGCDLVRETRIESDRVRTDSSSSQVLLLLSSLLHSPLTHQTCHVCYITSGSLASEGQALPLKGLHHLVLAHT